MLSGHQFSLISVTSLRSLTNRTWRHFIAIFLLCAFAFNSAESQIPSQYNPVGPSAGLFPNSIPGSLESQHSADLLIETTAGTVQGDYKHTASVQTVSIRQFIGIPFAQKPIGYYRFSVRFTICFLIELFFLN
jgi:hypothetical protein